MKTLLQKMSVLAFACVFAFTGCQKGKDVEPEQTLESAEDNARVESESESVQNFIDIEAADPNMRLGVPSQTGNLTGCATRTWDPATETLTIDFGPVNCLGKDGRYRRGKIIAVFEGQWRTANSKVTMKPLDYYVNDNQHTGTRIVTSLINEDAVVAKYKYRVEVINAGIVFTDGSTRNWNAVREVERVSGKGTPSIADDEYLIAGNSSGTNRRNVQFTSVITQPLKKVFRPGCFRNFIAGKVFITNSNNKSMELNYDPAGTEVCDKTATVSANGKIKTITLR